MELNRPLDQLIPYNPKPSESNSRLPDNLLELLQTEQGHTPQAKPILSQYIYKLLIHTKTNHAKKASGTLRNSSHTPLNPGAKRCNWKKGTNKWTLGNNWLLRYCSRVYILLISPLIPQILRVYYNNKFTSYPRAIKTYKYLIRDFF
jgi:hypothetical protein